MDHQTLVWSLGLLILSNILGIWRVTAAQNKRIDDKFVEMEKAFNNKFSSAKVNVDSVFEKISEQHQVITVQMTKILEGDIREFRTTISRLNDALETSRGRIHELTNEMNVMVLKVDRLERPEKIK